MEKNKKTLILLTNFLCNNKCLICSVEEMRRSQGDRTLEELLFDIRKGREDGFKKIEFSGGEPTLRKDIFLLIDYAKKIGFSEIFLSTNGRRFKDEKFFKQIVKSGVKLVSVSLHAHKKEIHDKIVRSPGAFEQTINGIRNIQDRSSINIMLITVISRINYKFLYEMGAFFIKKLKIKEWNISNLIPEGNGSLYYHFLNVGPFKIAAYLKEVCKFLEEKEVRLSFFDFPFCFFPSRYRNYANIDIISSQRRDDLFEEKGQNYSNRIYRINHRDYGDTLKTRIGVCYDCIYRERCGGIWKKGAMEYPAMKSEVKFLAKTNGCLFNGK